MVEEIIKENSVYINDQNWVPLSVQEVFRLFSSFKIPWWIAGGWALDLFLGKQTREHLDIDILILRKDQLYLQKKLENWILFRTQSPDLDFWKKNEFLQSPVNSIWVKDKIDSPFRFEIMLMDTERNEWIYRRDKRIRGKIRELGLRTKDGIPYLKPEIQLLYKGGRNFREKDLQDFLTVKSSLDKKQKDWLVNALNMQFPDVHRWIEILNS